MKIGIITDCFKLPLLESLEKAKELKIDGVQIYATTGTFSPEVLDQETKDKYKKIIKDNHLVVSALCGDMGGHGFEIAKDNPERIRKTKAIIDLAVEFDCHVITTHIGVIPNDETSEKFKVMSAALRECGEYAKSKDVILAIETGPEKATTLLKFLKTMNGGVGVNLDPANFVMVTKQDPVKAVYLLKDYIVHTHAKDGIMLKETDPLIIYNHFAEGGIEALNVADYFIETPLGKGNVDFKAYLWALKDIGYKGFLTIERETGENPVADIELAVNFLRQFDVVGD